MNSLTSETQYSGFPTNITGIAIMKKFLRRTKWTLFGSHSFTTSSSCQQQQVSYLDTFQKYSVNPWVKSDVEWKVGIFIPITTLLYLRSAYFQ